MPIAQVLMSDSFGQWVTKTNQMITQVNSLAITGSVLSVTSPSTAQLLVYDGTFFKNVTMSGDATINSSGVVVVSANSGGGVTKGRLLFAGAMRSIY